MFGIVRASSAQSAFAVLSRPRTGIAGLLQQDCVIPMELPSFLHD